MYDTNDDDRAIAFCSDAGLEKLAKSDQWHIDGTFQAAPLIYYQLLIIHTYLFGFMFPCWYILLKSKDYNMYKKVIEKLKESSGRFNLNPKRLTVKGCMFHYAQCIWRNVNTFDFKTNYLKDEAFILKTRRLSTGPRTINHVEGFHSKFNKYTRLLIRIYTN